MLRMLLVVVALLVLGGGLFLWERALPGDDPIARRGLQASAPSQAPDQALVPGDLAAPSARSAADPRTETGAPGAGEAVEPSLEPELDRDDRVPEHVSGRVLDLEGVPQPGLVVVEQRAPERVLGETRGDGGFEVELPRGTGDLVVQCGEWATVRAATVRDTWRGLEQTIIVAPRIELAGRVTGSGQQPIEGAHVAVHLPLEVLRRFPLALDRTKRLSWSVETAADGSFSLPCVPGVVGGELRTSLLPLRVDVVGEVIGSDAHAGAAQRWREDVRALPPESRYDLAIELVPLAEELSEDPEAKRVLGRVEYDDGDPAPGAAVHLGEASTVARSDGTFTLRPEPGAVAAEMPLVAVQAGSRPAVLPGFGARFLEDTQPPPVVLTLGGTALSIRGVVRRADGSPAAGWSLRLMDGTAVTAHQVPSTSVEQLARSDGRRALRTDEDGSFEIGGLVDRVYHIRAWNPETLVAVDSGPVAAGEDVLLVVPADATFPRFEGRVVGLDRAPVAGVEVTVAMITDATPGYSARSWTTGATTVTDEDGTFAFVDFPRHGVYLKVRGEAVVEREFYPDEDVDPDKGTFDEDEIELSVFRRCDLRYRWTGADPPPDRLGVLDAAGSPIAITVHSGGGWSRSTRVRLTDGELGVVSTSEAAVTLVLFREGAELERRPIALTPGEVTLVE